MSKSETDRGLETVLVEYRPRLHAFIARMTHDANEVEDLVQETLIKASRGWGARRQGAKVSSWLFTIAANSCVDFFRRARTRSEYNDEQIDRHADKRLSHSDALVEERMNDCLRSKMDALSPAYRSALILHDMEGIKLRIIAEQEGVSEGAMRVRIHRARKKLRHIIETGCEVTKGKERGLLCEPKESGSAPTLRPRRER